MLKLQRQEAAADSAHDLEQVHLDPVWVVEKVFTIGSASDNNLVLEAPSVSPYHARLVSEKGRYVLYDTDSAKGSFINGRRVTQCPLGCGDVIRIGKINIAILDPLTGRTGGTDTEEGYWALIADAGWLAGQEFPLTPIEGKELLIGRGNRCDIVFPGTQLSREHARLALGKEHVLITDLRSTTGTYLNDTQISGSAKAVAGDRLRLDIYNFTLLGPGMTLPQPAAVRLAEARETAMNATGSADRPKRWRTRSTSPGNRQEAVSSESSPTLIILSVLLLVALVLVSLYLLLN